MPIIRPNDPRTEAFPLETISSPDDVLDRSLRNKMVRQHTLVDTV